jgi:hypothetical protein
VGVLGLLTNGEWANMDSTFLQQPDEIFKCPDVLTHPGFHGGYHIESFLYPRGVVIHVNRLL